MASNRIIPCDDQTLHSNLSRMYPLSHPGKGWEKEKGWFIQLAISEEQQSLSEKAVIWLDSYLFSSDERRTSRLLELEKGMPTKA